MASSELPRNGAVWHHELPDNQEIVVYPLLFGRATLCCGRMRIPVREGRPHPDGLTLYEQWEKGYEYNTVEEAIEGGKGWINTDQPPPGNWTREVAK